MKPDGQFVFSSSTFAVGAYNAAAAETALAAMQADGYDAVRVFLDVTCASGCLFDPAPADGLSRRTSQISSTSWGVRRRTGSTC